MIDSAKCFFLMKHQWVALHPNLPLWSCRRCGKVKSVSVKVKQGE